MHQHLDKSQQFFVWEVAGIAKGVSQQACFQLLLCLQAEPLSIHAAGASWTGGCGGPLCCFAQVPLVCLHRARCPRELRGSAEAAHCWGLSPREAATEETWFQFLLTELWQLLSWRSFTTLEPGLPLQHWRSLSRVLRNLLVRMFHSCALSFGLVQHCRRCALAAAATALPVPTAAEACSEGAALLAGRN